MIQYIGTKSVKAEPMNESKAVELGYARANEDNHEWREGYHVLYPDGYHSWSPKEVFEKAYRCSETYLDRMLIESNDLHAKIRAGKVFMQTAVFTQLPLFKQRALIAQLGAMELYIDFLQDRIDSEINEACNGA